jgi:hypothetical protein
LVKRDAIRSVNNKLGALVLAVTSWHFLDVKLTWSTYGIEHVVIGLFLLFLAFEVVSTGYDLDDARDYIGVLESRQL